MEAHSLLWASFPKDENGWPSSYPEDYAGCYIDEASDLVILLVNPTEKSKEAYKELCGNSSRVKFKAAQYSMEELEGYIAEINGLAKKYELVSWYIDQKNNSISIEVLKQDYNAINNLTKSVSAKTYAPFNIVSVAEKAETTATSVYGGMEFFSKTGNSGVSEFATIGVCGRYNGKSAVLTAGHCFYAEGNTMYNRNRTSAMGTVKKKSYQAFTSNGDYAIVELNNNYTATNQVLGPSGTKISITNYTMNVPIGTLVMKYGASTGYTTGTVEAINATAEYNKLAYYGLTRVKMNQVGTSKGINVGDSGGPVFFKQSVQYRIVGNISGRAGDYTMFFCDIRYALNAGFTVKTY